MKKYPLLVICILGVYYAQSQQFSFLELVDIIQSSKKFEQNMHIKANDIIEIKKGETSYCFENGISSTPPDSIDYSICAATFMNFAENYDRQSKSASTFYSLKTSEQINNKGNGDTIFNNSVTMYFANDVDYNSLLSQISSKSRYKKTMELLGSYYIYYTYKVSSNLTCEISCRKGVDRDDMHYISISIEDIKLYK